MELKSFLCPCPQSSPASTAALSTVSYTLVNANAAHSWQIGHGPGHWRFWRSGKLYSLADLWI